MVDATVISRTAHCSSLSYGKRHFYIYRLQCCQRNAHSRWTENQLWNSAPLLQGTERPWLAKSRIVIVKISRPLLSEDRYHLNIPKLTLGTFDKQASAKADSTRWNSQFTPQCETRSIRWPVQQTILIVYLHSSVMHFVEKWMQVIY